MSIDALCISLILLATYGFKRSRTVNSEEAFGRTLRSWVML